MFNRSAILFLFFMTGLAQSETSGELAYEVVGDSIQITGCNQTAVGLLVIPSEIEDKPVVAIGGLPHEYSKALTGFLVPETVTNINSRIFFYCKNLESIKVAEDNPSYVSKNGVLFNKGLTTLIRCPSGKSDWMYVPKGVVSIADRAFLGCGNLKKIILPDGLISIGNEAFFRCENLEYITLPDSLVSIGNLAFWVCDSLVDIHISENVSSIGRNALSYCNRLEKIEVAEGNESYKSQEGVLFNKDQSRLIQYPRNKLGPYIVPSTVTAIDGGAFGLCKGLTEITFPQSLKSIGSKAFELCDGLRIIRIPAAVEKIDHPNSSFERCRNLEAFVVEKDNQHYASRDGVLFDKNLTRLIQCPAKKCGAYVVPEGVESIANSAFSYCRGLTNILLPDSLVSIGTLAFDECDGLKAVTIPDAVESIGGFAFSNCGGLTNIIISASVQNAKSWSDGVTVIVRGENQNYTSTDGVLFSKDLTELIRCPIEKVGSYEVPDSVTSIAESAFKNCYNLTSITLPESLSSIGRFSFYNCSSIDSIIVPASVQSIGRLAFASCKGAESIRVEEANRYYTSVDGVLFNNDLTELIQFPLGRSEYYSVPESTTTIKENAFAGSSLTRIDLSESTSIIERTAFSICRNLSEICFPKSIAFIDEYAFGNCSNLTHAVFMGNAPVLGNSAFYKTDPEFTVYYSSRNSGFTSPVWKGYRAEPIHPLMLWMRMNRRFAGIILLSGLIVSSLGYYAVRHSIRRKK